MHPRYSAYAIARATMEQSMLTRMAKMAVTTHEVQFSNGEQSKLDLILAWQISWVLEMKKKTGEAENPLGPHVALLWATRAMVEP
jgi:hypothetical protein